DFLPPGPALAKAVQAEAAALAAQAGVHGADSGLPEQLEELSRQYTTQALLRLGWSAEPGAVVQADTLAVASGHRRLLNRLLGLVAGGGLLRAEDGRWRVLGRLEAVDPQALTQDLGRRYPQAAVELALLGRCGQHLAAVLRGQVDPLGLLF